MIIDNMPAATKIETSKGQFVYQTGFPLGVIVDGAAYVHNHIVFTVLYHEEEKSKGNNRVVGFEARGYSVAHPSVGAVKSPVGMDKYKPQPVREKEAIVYSYDVVWEKSDVKWATRWDNYLKMQDAQVHWFSIINSLLIIFFLTGMVALILVRVLRRDFARYNGLETAEEAVEETGWKLVYGDVFRAPRFFGALSVLVGVGCQITMMCVVTIIFAAIGYLSPARRGYLLTACIIFFDVSSLFAGYYSARFYKFFKGTSWKSNTLYAAFAFPLTIFGIFLVLNHLHSKEDSTGAVPVRSLLMLMGVWFSLSTPLAHLGAYWGYRKEEFEVPVRTNQIPRQVPDQPWYMNSVLVCLVGGVMPFGACLIELYFILGSLYQNQSYYLFGFLLLVFIIVAVTCAEITIVFAYFQLCSEDYHWWWRSFLTAGASAGYVFLYSLNYLSKLQFDRTVDRALFVGYTLIISLGFFAMTGTIGFLASFAFLRTIYGAIKID
jgi:transmembrane 9 superfamily protein 2/4